MLVVLAWLRMRHTTHGHEITQMSLNLSNSSIASYCSGQGETVQWRYTQLAGKIKPFYNFDFTC